jgi:hypothetical protein
MTTVETMLQFLLPFLSAAIVAKIIDLSIAEMVLSPKDDNEKEKEKQTAVKKEIWICEELPLNFRPRLIKYFDSMLVSDVAEMPIEVIVGLCAPEDRIIMKCFLSRYWRNPIVLWVSEQLCPVSNRRPGVLTLEEYVNQIPDGDKPHVSSLILINNQLTVDDFQCLKQLDRSTFPKLSLINITGNFVLESDLVWLKTEFPGISIINERARPPVLPTSVTNTPCDSDENSDSEHFC